MRHRLKHDPFLPLIRTVAPRPDHETEDALPACSARRPHGRIDQQFQLWTRHQHECSSLIGVQPRSRSRQREEWRVLVREWKAGGQRAKEFAGARQLSMTSLFYGPSMLKREAPTRAPARLLPVRVTTSPIGRPAEFELAVGRGAVRLSVNRGDLTSAQARGRARCLRARPSPRHAPRAGARYPVSSPLCA
ncbi:MAG: hypothetical protein JWN48_1152 [Myxococcaceae bacterium]|nr:hypothetical protein [Myxococcaceae bacterium]